MSNKRQPDNLKILKGTARKSRINQKQPVPKIVKRAKPPDFLKHNELALAEWERICPELEATKVLTTVDIGVLASYCIAYAQVALATEKLKDEGEVYITSTKEGEVKRKNPWIEIRNIGITLLVKTSTELGMTPSSRGKVSTVGAEKTESVWAD